MPAINPQDLNNAKLDVDHMAALATSSALTAVDRFGQTKKTWTGIEADLGAAAAITETGQNRAAAQTAQAGAASERVGAQAERAGAEAARDAALIQAGVYETEAAGRAAVADGQAFKVQGSGDIAAFEYRRVSSSVSTLIVSYPAAGAVLPLRESSNLFNPATALDGVVVGSLGNTTANADFFTSDYIPVEELTQYTFSPAAVVKPFAFYGESKNYLSPFASHATSFTTPANARFVRVSARKSEWLPERYMVVKGASLPSTYQIYLGLGAVRRGERNVSGGYAGLSSTGKIPLSAIPFADSQNLFDLSTITADTYINASGVPTAAADFYTSAKVPVTPFTTYSFSTTGVGKYASFYDAAGVFIAGALRVGIATSPAGAAFMTVSPRYSETPPGTFMLVEGSTLPSVYQPYAGVSIERQIHKNRPGGYAGLDSAGRILLSALPSSAASPLAGKLIAGLGDSITYGFIPRNAPGYPGQLQSYLPLLAARMGASVSNHGISGSTLAPNSSGADSPMCRRFAAMPDSADLVIVMGGTNDVRKGVPLGTFGDTTDATFFGGLYVLCSGLLQKYRYGQGLTVGKAKKIMFMTALRLDITPNALLPSYNAATKQVCQHFGIPVFDAFNLSGLTPDLFRTLQGTEAGYTALYNPYVPDGTHPNQEGNEIFVDAVEGFVRALY